MNNDKDKDKDLLTIVKEQNETIIGLQKRLLKEVFYNRVIYTICLIIALLYVHFQFLNVSEILGMLIQIFLPT